jgi:NAD(P)-dependent dehydrogenase (short-subunit alcohol dehydrogenase family)
VGKLDGRAALITGAGSGMGRASALRFAAEGASVVVVDIDGDAAAATVAAVAEAGGQATAVTADAADVDGLDDVLAVVDRTYGRLDVLFCHAGGGSARGGLSFELEDFDRTFGLNVRGAAFLCQRAAGRLEASGHGAIVLTASVAALHGSGPVLYGASKAALVHFTRSLAVRLGPRGIRANAILPGPVDTPAFRRFLQGPDPSSQRPALHDASGIPLQRIARPDEIAAVALFLASDDASFVTGTALPVDGGLSVTGR